MYNPWVDLIPGALRFDNGERKSVVMGEGGELGDRRSSMKEEGVAIRFYHKEYQIPLDNPWVDRILGALRFIS